MTVNIKCSSIATAEPVSPHLMGTVSELSPKLGFLLSKLLTVWVPGCVASHVDMDGIPIIVDLHPCRSSHVEE